MAHAAGSTSSAKASTPTTPTAPTTTSKSVQWHWRGRSQTGAPIIVKDRCDRVELISVYLSGKQILQIPITDLIKKDIAINIMVSIAEDFSQGKLARAQLFLQRNKLLKEKGIVMKRQAKIFKRPSRKSDKDDKSDEHNDESCNAKGGDISIDNSIDKSIKNKRAAKAIEVSKSAKASRTTATIAGPPMSMLELPGL